MIVCYCDVCGCKIIDAVPWNCFSRKCGNEFTHDTSIGQFRILIEHIQKNSPYTGDARFDICVPCGERFENHIKSFDFEPVAKKEIA